MEKVCLGVNSEDPFDGDIGPNGLQNAPVLGRAVVSDGRLLVGGSLHSAPNRDFTIQVFASPEADPSGHGEGAIFVTSFTVRTDDLGDATFEIDRSALPAHRGVVSATATSLAGDTSEFSNAVYVATVRFDFEIAAQSAGEGQGATAIVVVRSGVIDEAATVRLTATGGSATAVMDFTPLDITLSFEPGETTRSIPLVLINDAIREDDETVLLTLSDPSTNAAVGPVGQSVVTILDDDNPGRFQLESLDVAVPESAGVVRLKVNRTNGTAGTISLPFLVVGNTAQAGVDFISTSGTLIFGPGQTSATIEVPILNDSFVEPTESFVVALLPPSDGVLVRPAMATVSILNDDRDLSGPRVVDVTPQLGAGGISYLEVQFDRALDPGRAVDLYNYGGEVVSAGRDQRLGTIDDQKIRWAAAYYDPGAVPGLPGSGVTVAPESVEPASHQSARRTRARLRHCQRHGRLARRRCRRPGRGFLPGGIRGRHTNLVPRSRW